MTDPYIFQANKQIKSIQEENKKAKADLEADPPRINDFQYSEIIKKNAKRLESLINADNIAQKYNIEKSEKKNKNRRRFNKII